MDLKRTFGTVLTTLGIIILMYGGYMFIKDTDSSGWRAIAVALLLGIIFFGSGIGLVKGIKEDR